MATRRRRSTMAMWRWMKKAQCYRADPLAQFQACVEAEPAFRLSGRRGVGSTEMPKPDQPLHESAIGYYAHAGGHNLTAFDWRMFMDFADRHFDLHLR